MAGAVSPVERAIIESSVALTPPQAAFVREYVKDLDSLAAAHRAGVPGQHGRMLKNTVVVAALRKALEKPIEKYEISGERVLTELAKIGFANLGDFFEVGEDGAPRLNFKKLSRDDTAALAEVTVDEYVEGSGESARPVKKVKFKLADKQAALVNLGKNLGLFVEKREITGPNGGPIEIAAVRERIEERLSRIRDANLIDVTPKKALEAE